MDEKVSILLVEDTEEMVSWRSKGQEEIDEFWKRIAEQIKDEVLENTRWRIAKEKPGEEEVCLRGGVWSEEPRNISLENGVKIVGQEFSHRSEDISCNVRKACRKVKQRRKR